jgi:hypothetical protein
VSIARVIVIIGRKGWRSMMGIKSIIYKNGIATKVKNKKVVTIDHGDDTFSFEVTRMLKEGEDLDGPFCGSFTLRDKAKGGSMRLSRESATILLHQLAWILQEK